MTKARYLFIAGLAALGSCGDDGGGSVTAAQACSSAATAFCNKINMCAPVFIQFQYGDVATCVTRIQINCEANFMASGKSQTPSELAACGTAYGNASCSDLFAGDQPAACDPKPGTLADGTACGVPDQCVSTYCKLSGSCGVCAPRSATGGSCTEDEGCADGLVCAGAGTCVTPGAAGAACDDVRPCRGNLNCKSGSCAAPGGPGSPCTPFSDGECDFAQGLYCSPSGACEVIKLANAGETCGYSPSTGFTACRAGGDCKTGLGGTGTCTPAASDGAACGGVDGPNCLAPSECEAETCKLPPSASTCK